MHPWLEAPVLEGALVRLEPLAARHAGDLAAAAEEDRGRYGFTLVPRGSEIGGYLDAQPRSRSLRWSRTQTRSAT